MLLKPVANYQPEIVPAEWQVPFRRCLRPFGSVFPVGLRRLHRITKAPLVKLSVFFNRFRQTAPHRMQTRIYNIAKHVTNGINLGGGGEIGKLLKKLFCRFILHVHI